MDAGVGADAVHYGAAAVLGAVSGGASGLLTGAVLQRVVPLLPVRTWIGLHTLMAIIVVVGSEYGFTILPSGPNAADDVSTAEMLSVGAILGAGLGVISGGLEALVLRKVAGGVNAWIAWSTLAYAVGGGFFGGWVSIRDTGRGVVGELVHQTVGLLTVVIIAVVMLPVLRRLGSPLLAKAGEHFT